MAGRRSQSNGQAQKPVPVVARNPASGQIRVECLKAAMQIITPSTTAESIIDKAKQFESYVTGDAA